MSNEIKQGDKVRVSENAPKVYLSSVNNLFKYHVCKVEETDGDSAKIRYTDIGIDRWLAIPCKYLVKVDAEAKSKDDSCRWEGKIVYNCKSHKSGGIIRIVEGGAEVITEYGERRIWPLMDLLDEYNNPFEKWKCAEPTEQTEEEETKTKGDTLTFPIAFDLTDSYWDAYAADLAKEVALKVANKYNDPKEAAEYAVSVAKAVVEGLKRK